MKKLLFLFITIFTLLSCENDFDLTEDWKDITIVYGLLDQSQPTQYIRIEKAFLDPTTSALILAQEADSLYYDDIFVELVESGNGGNIYELEPVNAIDEGFTRAEGVFATTPNILYKLTAPIREDFTYELRITKNGDTDNQVKAQTDICQDFELTSPLTSNSANTIDYIRFRTNAETPFRWTPPSNSKIFTLNLLINYKEAPLSDPTNFSTKQLTWTINDKVTPDNGSLARISVDGDKFFEFMDNSLEAGFVRSLDSLDVEIVSGAVDILNYLEAGQINGGITSADLIPSYTNLSEGLGLFSSRHHKQVTGFQLEALSLDSLQAGYLTRDLGF